MTLDAQTMHRFFVPPEWIDGSTVTLSDSVAHQLTRVLRVRPGEQIVVLDGSGCEYTVTLETVERDRVSGTVDAKALATGEPGIRITLYQGVLKTDKFEYVLQKGTELGIASFVPVVCARSIPKERGDGSNRLARWQRIVTEAAEQSRRSKIPSLTPAIPFSEACDSVSGPAIIPWEEEQGIGLRSWLRQLWSESGGRTSLGIFIGPEGGFTPEEVAYACSKGITAVSLGRRILRAETAGIVTATAALYQAGELGA